MTPEIATFPSIRLEAERIEDAPGPYCMSFEFDLAALTRSIERFGLINSPLLIEKHDTKVAVVAGYRRMLAMKELGWSEIPCRVLPAPPFTDAQCLLLNLYENLAVRNLNHIEKAMVLDRLGSHLPKSEIVDRYMPLLGLPQHEPTFLFYVTLEREFGQEIKREIANGRLSLQVARVLLAIDENSRAKIFRFLRQIKLNTNQQKDFIEYLVDLSHRNQTSISEILEEKFIQTICSDPRLNSPQKAKELLRHFRNIRFPRLTRAEKRFKKAVANLALPKGVRIKAPPYFESPDYSLEIIFKNGKGLKRAVEDLSGLADLEDIGNPWERNE